MYSRDEWHPAAPVEPKVVEAVFERFAGVGILLTEFAADEKSPANAPGNARVV